MATPVCPVLQANACVCPCAAAAMQHPRAQGFRIPGRHHSYPGLPTLPTCPGGPSGAQSAGASSAAAQGLLPVAVAGYKLAARGRQLLLCGHLRVRKHKRPEPLPHHLPCCLTACMCPTPGHALLSSLTKSSGRLHDGRQVAEDLHI